MTIPVTLTNAEEEEERFRELFLTELHTAWTRTALLQRLVRGVPPTELHEAMLTSVYEFAAAIALRELEVTRDEFLDDMGTAFDMASTEGEEDDDGIHDVQDLIDDVEGNTDADKPS